MDSTGSQHRQRGQDGREYVLCFRSLFASGRGYAFPCDENGRVDTAGMSDRLRCNYARARSEVGRELALPRVELRMH